MYLKAWLISFISDIKSTPFKESEDKLGEYNEVFNQYLTRLSRKIRLQNNSEKNEEIDSIITSITSLNIENTDLMINFIKESNRLGNLLIYAKIISVFIETLYSYTLTGNDLSYKSTLSNLEQIFLSREKS